MEKYCLIESRKQDLTQPLYQIQALQDFVTVNGQQIKIGDLGGFVAGEHNLSQKGNCWIAEDGIVQQKAFVSDNAYVSGGRLTGNVRVSGNAEIIGKHILIGGGLYFEEQAKVINDHSTQKIVMEGEGCIGGNALIRSQNDFIQSKIFSDFMEEWVAYKTETGFEIRGSDQSFSAEQVRKALLAYSEYETAVRLAKSRLLGGF